MRRRVCSLVFAGSLLITAPLLPGNSIVFAARAAQAQSSVADVKIDNFSFGPATLTVAIGTTVDQSRRHPAYRSQRR